MSNYWTQYWQQGNLTSFGDDLSNNYRGEIKEIWQSFFKSIKDEDKILDVGTGNGALIALAFQLNGDCKSSFVGIDYAQLNIQEAILLDNEQVNFYSEINAESLPFSNDEFNAVVAQFSLEYTKIKDSLVEISRVLKKSGRFQFICHCANSLIVKPNLAILKVSINIKKKAGLLDTAKELVVLLSNPSNRSLPETEKLRRRLNKLIHDQVILDNSSFSDTNFPLFIRRLFSTKAPQVKKQMIQEYEKELDGVILRLTDLARAALTEKSKNKLLYNCKKNDLIIDRCDLIKQLNGDVVGYIIAGSKVASIN